MRIVILSDTHGKHEELGVLSGDVCNAFRRDSNEVAQLDAWFGRRQFARILCIGGNHDFALQKFAARADWRRCRAVFARRSLLIWSARSLMATGFS